MDYSNDKVNKYKDKVLNLIKRIDTLLVDEIGCKNYIFNPT
jgi:hypothetical protein